jgi:predicted ATPase/DNA-binding CsgD family transcriptional regulator
MQAPFADPLSGLESLQQALPLVGREVEMQLIWTQLDTVSLARPAGARALMISGDIGVGKTRLLAQTCAAASARGFRVLEGRAYEAGCLFPYFPFIEALRPVIHSSSQEQLRHYLGLDDDQRENATSSATAMLSLTGTSLVAALSRLFPQLPQKLQVRLEREVLSPDQEKFRLFDAVATLLERMSLERPVLLSIDNLQWADSASMELTLYLTVRLHSSQVALVGVTRPPHAAFSTRAEAGDRIVSMAATNSAARALGELMRQGLLLLLPLGPLSEEAAAQHLHALLPGTLSQRLVQSLLTRVEGSPFFLEELVRALTLSGQLVQHKGVWRATKAIGTALPGSITLTVEQRLQGLSCRELLRVAALFGRSFPQRALMQVVEVPEEQAQILLDEAIQAAVIARVPAREDELTAWTEDVAEAHSLSSLSSAHHLPATFLFCHGIVQEVLSVEVPAHQARFLHGAIGQALEAEYLAGNSVSARGTPTDPCAELARHYVLSNEKEAALYWSLLAGEDAARQQAHCEAISHFRVALKLLEAGTQAYRGEKLPPAAQMYITVGESWFKLGELEQAAQAFQQALEHLQHEQQLSASSALLLAKANRLLADVYRMQAKYELALAHLQAASSALYAMDAETGEREDVNDVNTEPRSLSWFSGWTPHLAPTQSAYRLLAPDPVSLKPINATERLLLLQAQATLDLLLLRAKEAETAFWHSHQLATEIGDRGSQAFALHMIGWIRGWGESIYEAIRLLAQARELYQAIGDPFRATLGDQGLGIIYQALGEMEKARVHNIRGLEQARRYGVRQSLGWLYWNQAVMALAQGNWTESEAHFQRALQDVEASNNVRLKAAVFQAQAELQFRRGNWHEAEQSFQAAIQAAANTDWYPGTLALSGHFLAVTGRRGRAAAKTQLDLAAAHPEPIGFSGHFYIPFLAEGYLHLEENERAATYIERIRKLRGFMYYGTSVDRILGEVAALKGDWDTAEQAFEDGLLLCRRANNEPEEAAILYEQARSSLMRSGTEPEDAEGTSRSVQHMQSLCDQARVLFLKYNMQRAANLVDTLQAGVRQLEQRAHTEPTRQIVQQHIAHPEYHLDLHLTKREREVLRLVAEGHTDREVAETLVISPRTVNRHLSNIFVKLNVPGRAAAVAFAIRQGMVG